MSAKDKALITLSQYQEEVFIGMILSDAWLSKSGNNYRLVFEQKQEKFVKFLWNIFKPMVGREPFKRIRKRTTNNVDKTFESWSFQTLVFPFFTELHKKWYVQTIDPITGKFKFIKIIPVNIVITPVVLAFWISGDGSLDKISGVMTLYTNSFTHEEVLRLSNLLNVQYNLSTYVYVRQGKYNLIKIPKKDMEKVKEICLPHIHEDFYYKLGIK